MQVRIELAVWYLISGMPQGNDNFWIVLLDKVNGTVDMLKLDKGTKMAWDSQLLMYTSTGRKIHTFG